jgi:hypothetical protein
MRNSHGAKNPRHRIGHVQLRNARRGELLHEIICPKHAFSQLADSLTVVARLGNVDHSFVAGNSAKAAEATANFH